jgi:non-ribosomal peptide synthetase component E (peptide arylation enzyme)
MTMTNRHRPLALGLGLTLALVASGCSKQSSEVAAYCEKAKVAVTVSAKKLQPYDTVSSKIDDSKASTTPAANNAALLREQGKSLDEMMAAAPSAISADAARAKTGDMAAMAKVSGYTRDQCGVDLDAK